MYNLHYTHTQDAAISNDVVDQHFPNPSSSKSHVIKKPPMYSCNIKNNTSRASLFEMR